MSIRKKLRYSVPVVAILGALLATTGCVIVDDNPGGIHSHVYHRGGIHSHTWHRGRYRAHDDYYSSPGYDDGIHSHVN